METNNETLQDRLLMVFRSGKLIKPVVTALIGGVLGFAYYYFVGCDSGNCLFSGDPIASTFVGMLGGLFVVYSPCSRGQC